MGNRQVGAPLGAERPGEDKGSAGAGAASSPRTPAQERGADDAKRKRGKPRSFWKELPILVGIALVLALLIKTFFIQAFSIPSGSMQNTLKKGDRVLVDKLTPWFGSKPERGEVVVFHDPGHWLPQQKEQPNPLENVLSFIGLRPSSDEENLIKRVIAVGGDTVECKAPGPVKVNGKALKEPYIFPGNTPCGDRPFGPVKVPEGRMWVMGDHRQSSWDSRYHQDIDGGTVAMDQAVGRAFVVAWPVDRWSTLPVPDTFQKAGPIVDAAGYPAALGLVGALPLVLWRRRRLNIRR
ncbi:signal peptidase I [Streptomyces sp. NPDC053427]|uniref:signal peptidase I n=1 Tax=Streptomyces sp. NPDC053427 TaxID=3365701 RepID=UPI0037CE866F